jgi:hypothetical protein
LFVLLMGYSPPLKAATVFSGIAGFMSMEHGARDEPGQVPSLSTNSRETMDLYDYYRRTWAASYACGENELTPDEVIEDIWTGGDGFGGNPPKFDNVEDEEIGSDGDSQRTARGSRKGKGRKKQPTEFDLREDLRSWEISIPKE